MDAESKQLAVMLKTMSAKEIASKLDRSVFSVLKTAKRLGLRHPPAFYFLRPDYADRRFLGYPKELREAQSLQRQIERRLNELDQ